MTYETSRLLRLAAVTAVALPLLAACGDDQQSAQEPAGQQPPTTTGTAEPGTTTTVPPSGTASDTTTTPPAGGETEPEVGLQEEPVTPTPPGATPGPSDQPVEGALEQTDEAIRTVPDKPDGQP
ncbi:hypothetical protein [Rhodospirillum centenum]|uniref:Lipoprotein n=1 Tax=Rhodospirillum centenum (strain ATCC 51521 / SW) TaxID=414684 RepID=B6IRT2_RHOCS|nr:hypothetical protein [Rhodospirillum centenum]ACI98168.1 hypothetical protein RC1_0737 [Rhodospirillum centenum SW]